MAKKAMKKLKEVEKKGLKLSVTENGEEGKSKMIASCGFLQNELRQFCEQNTLTRHIFSCLHAYLTVSHMTLAQDGCAHHVIHVSCAVCVLTSLRLSTLHSSQSLSSYTSLS